MTHPAGWHQDPGNPNLERYWDGQQWTDQTRPHGQAAAPGTSPDMPPKKSRKWPWVVGGGVVGFFVIMGIIGAIVGPQEEESTAATASTTTTAATTATMTQPTTTTTTQTPSSTTQPTTTVDTTTAAAPASFSDPRCAPADPAMVEWIAAGLIDSSLEVENAVVIDDDGLLFIGASTVRPDGKFENRSDVWIVQDSLPYASTGGARNTTEWPKASDALGISPGDERVQAVDACVVELTRG